MTVSLMSENEIDCAFSHAEELMISGRWTEAEAIIRECCSSKSDLTLRLSQLEWRKECAEYASTLDHDELTKSELIQTLSDQFDQFVADWAINKYRG